MAYRFVNTVPGTTHYSQYPDLSAMTFPVNQIPVVRALIATEDNEPVIRWVIDIIEVEEVAE